MKESIQAALSVVRSRARNLGLRTTSSEDRFAYPFARSDSKDGPSAGGICASMYSALTSIPVRAMLNDR